MINWIQRIPQRSAAGLVAVVDGGATHCRVAITSADGTLAGYATGGPTNARSVGDRGAAANLVGTLRAALGDAGDDDGASVLYCLVTSASVDTVAHSEFLSDAVRAVLPAAVTATVPDTMGCWASTNALAPAVAVIAGTGSVVVAADRDRGLWRRFGGWDFLLGDEGSGYGIGRAALQETLLVTEGRSGASALAAAVMASDAALGRGITEPDGIPDAVHKPAIDKAWIASFAPTVLELAGAGDDDARRIVARESGILAAATAAAIDALGPGLADDEEITVGLFGGTFASEVLTATFSAAVAELTERPVTAVVPEHSALVGAFTIALGWGPGGDDPAGIEAANDRLTAAVAAHPGST